MQSVAADFQEQGDEARQLNAQLSAQYEEACALEHQSEQRLALANEKIVAMQQEVAEPLIISS